MVRISRELHLILDITTKDKQKIVVEFSKLRESGQRFSLLDEFPIDNYLYELRAMNIGEEKL